MARSKQKNAEELIDNFARDLLALNDGKAISRQLKNHLLKAIKPSPAKRGVKLSYGRVAEIAKQLTLSREEIDRLRTKHHNPASYKDEIASAAGVSRKTVERINVGIEEYFSQVGFSDPNLRKAIVDGIAAAISEEMKKEEG